MKGAFLVVGMSTKGKYLRKKFLLNPYLKEEKDKRIKISEGPLRKEVDAVYIKNFNRKGPSYIFSNQDIEVIITLLEGTGMSKTFTSN